MTAADRVRVAVVTVVGAALAERGVSRVAMVDDGSPEAELLGDWLTRGLGAQSLVRVDARAPGLESLLHAATAAGADARTALGLAARLVPDALPAAAENKTSLLLGGALPAERLLPLGDVWASQVQQMAGGWTASPEVLALARRAGGVDALDSALARWLEGRDHRALDALDPEVAEEICARFAAGRAERIHPLLVPKLSSRTLGVDLFE